MDVRRFARITVVGIGVLALSQCSTPRSVPGELRQPASESILAIDSAWARAYARNDTVLAKQLMADDFFMTTTSGAVKDKTAELGDVRAQPGLRMDYFRTNDVRSRVYDGAAVVTGEAAWQFEMNGRVVANRRRYTAVYARGGPLGWQLVALHMGRAPDAPPARP